MKQALEDNTRYCHAFCQIPKVKLICTIEDEANGALEMELIQKADETHQKVTTHRQMTLEAKKNNKKANFDLKGMNHIGQGASKKLNEKIDFSTSEGQIKCSSQLTTIFNLQDKEKANKNFFEEDKNEDDEKMDISGKDLADK